MDGIKRNILAKLNTYLSIFPAVLILGVRQCGKTTLARQARPGWQYFDLENADDYDLISRDPGFFFKEYSTQVIIDEAQEYPRLFKQLRGVIDADRGRKNRFILSASSSPDLMQQAGDSLAGRLGIIELGTLKANELHQQSLPWFYQLFNQTVSSGSLSFLKDLKDHNSERDVMDDFLHGGYPEPVLAKDDEYFKTWMQNYFQLYINRDVKKLFPRLDSIKYRRFVSMLSQLSGTIINKAQLGRSIDTSEVTIRDYLDIADKTFVWRMIPSYDKAKTKSIVKMPKGIVRDSGLNNFLGHIDNRDKLFRSPNVGRNFESFIIEELIKGLQCTQAMNSSYYYYRSKHGSEVDLILEGSFGVVPVEIKFGTNTQAGQLAALKKFIEDNAMPLGIVINNASEIRPLTEKIIQIPARYI